jgi:transcriptional regulator with XRE-family HTH domain
MVVPDGVISLGERLRSKREQLGLSQSQAARELDVARTAYRLWEMEAARPSPDRWRLIARWLGVSVATMLLAEDLIDDTEADRAAVIAGRLPPGHRWDADVDATDDFFTQEHASIDRRTLEGVVTQREADELSGIVERLRSTAEGPPRQWLPARLAKELAVEPQALAAARTAVIGVASDIPTHELDVAVQLTSELAATLVRDAPATKATSFTLELDVGTDVIRVKLTVPSAHSRGVRTMVDEAGWAWKLITQLASRWGAGTEGDAYTAWFEVDLPEARTDDARRSMPPTV